MLRNLTVQAGLIGDLLDELAINILRYGDREGGYALSVGCRGDDMTIALCDTMKSNAGAQEESDARKIKGCPSADHARRIGGQTLEGLRWNCVRLFLERSLERSLERHGQIGHAARITRTRAAHRTSWRLDDLESGRRKFQPRSGDPVA